MTEEDSKLVNSTLMGLVGFLVSHIYLRMTKKDDAQDGLSTATKLLEAQVSRLEADVKELKKELTEHIREERRRYDVDR